MNQENWCQIYRVPCAIAHEKTALMEVVMLQLKPILKGEINVTELASIAIWAFEESFRMCSGEGYRSQKYI